MTIQKFDQLNINFNMLTSILDAWIFLFNLVTISIVYHLILKSKMAITKANEAELHLFVKSPVGPRDDDKQV